MSEFVPEAALCDRGFRGVKRVGETEIHLPNHKAQVEDETKREAQRKRFRRRAAIEPIIGHLKSDHRMWRNYLAGTRGDQINVMMVAAAFNFRKWMREVLALIFERWMATLSSNVTSRATVGAQF